MVKISRSTCWNQLNDSMTRRQTEALTEKKMNLTIHMFRKLQKTTFPQKVLLLTISCFVLFFVRLRCTLCIQYYLQI